ncbi:type II secretion system protein [Marinobacter koreensis]|uniref:Type II secretion system protein n=1 Tax=Marinobacter koreensis TaxID=335974 RepID=A0ABW0RMF2_9GAMM|nr:type II secretion system protein [Marinobacter koreensis]
MKMMNAIPARNEKGFTLIELVMVIVILGILAAFALPRFADLGTDAKSATRAGILGAMKSASSIAHSKCLADNACNTSASTIETAALDGADVDMIYGYPDATDSGIIAAAQIDTALSDGGTSGAGETLTVTIDKDSTCTVTYQSPSAATGAPKFGGATKGCP